MKKPQPLLITAHGVKKLIEEYFKIFTLSTQCSEMFTHPSGLLVQMNLTRPVPIEKIGAVGDLISKTGIFL